MDLYDEYDPYDDDQSRDYVSPVENEFYEYMYDTQMSKQDKYLYEIFECLHKKCVSIVLPNEDVSLSDEEKLHTGKYIRTQEEDLEKMALRFPHTYNSVFVHFMNGLVHRINSTLNVGYSRDSIYGNTMYGVCGDYYEDNNNPIDMDDALYTMELIAKYVNFSIHGVPIRGIENIMLDAACKFGSISIFNVFINKNSTQDEPQYTNTQLLNMICDPSYRLGDCDISVQETRMEIVKTLLPNDKMERKMFVGNKYTMLYNKVGRQFHKAVSNKLYLIAQYIVDSCKKYGVQLMNAIIYQDLDETFEVACANTDMEAIQFCCRFDPYKYEIRNKYNVWETKCENKKIDTDTWVPIPNTDRYGVIRTLSNAKWEYMRLVLQSLHYHPPCHNALPIDIIREIAVY